MEPKGRQFLSVIQVYNKYNISKPTLYRWIRQGKIKVRVISERE